MVISYSRSRPKANEAFLTLHRADFDVGARCVLLGFMMFELRDSVVISALQWDET